MSAIATDYCGRRDAFNRAKHRPRTTRLVPKITPDPGSGTPAGSAAVVGYTVPATEVRRDPPIPTFLALGMHRIGREMQIARPDNDTEFDLDPLEQAPVP